MEQESEYVQKAIAYFGEALRLDDVFISSMFHQGLMFRRIADFTNALRLFTRVMQKLPDDKTVFIERGLVYQDMGNHKYAIQDFKDAIRIDPHSTLAYYYMGISKLKSNLITEAIADLSQSDVLDEAQELPGIYDGLGQCHHKLEDFDEALT